jgi:GDP-D-mannose 3', 5'-epimerase
MCAIFCRRNGHKLISGDMLPDLELSMNRIRQKKALVCGAGGFIGSHMVRRLKEKGYFVRGIDLKYPEFSTTEADEFFIHDLRDQKAERLFRLDNEISGSINRFYFDEVYQFAADMGGAGYIFTGEHDAHVMHNSAQINLNVCEFLKATKTKVFYSSSACMYPQEYQNWHNGNGDINLIQKAPPVDCSLKEIYAYPANPDSEYGWEKLFSERLYLAYARNHGLDVRIARFHNIYGPEGTYKGGKEKAPAAMCRKVAEESRMCGTGGHSPIEVWGPGDQTRSFLYIDDCIDAVRLLMQSGFKEPINIGSEEMISINDLAKMVINISGKSIAIKNIPGPTGVRGRNSNNDLIREKLKWEPKYSLRQGMELTYSWIKNRYETNL